MMWVLKAVTFFKGLPLWVYVCIAKLLALGAVVLWHRREVSDAEEAGKTSGAAAEREEQLVEIINRTETANETREDIQREVRDGTGRDLYNQCLRTARTTTNCERFLPSGEEADR
jgi:type III secretory pathway component EscV